MGKIHIKITDKFQKPLRKEQIKEEQPVVDLIIKKNYINKQ